jgi:hypothetical protein
MLNNAAMLDPVVRERVVGTNGAHGSRLISDDITDPNRSNPMGFYNDYILPRVINLAMRNRELRPIRERVAGSSSRSTAWHPTSPCVGGKIG